MKNKLTTFLLLVFSLAMLGNFLFTTTALAAIELVKSKDFGTVYYLDSRGARHPFPNLITYQSWYGADFSRIVTVSNEFLTKYPLAKNITIRSGTYLVKVTTDPKVYAIEPGGVLREIIDSDIAEKIYGKTWAKKVIDLPDVFFDNYIVGKPIESDRDLPNGILYKNTSLGKYYYKNNELLQPFESTVAILANHFQLSDAISSDLAFHQRLKPITSLNKNVFNLTAEPKTDKRDCENENLKAAVIFLADQEYTSAEVEKVEKIKKEIAERYNWVTNGLSQIDVSYPTIILANDKYLLQKRNDGTTEINNEVVNTFYDNNPDAFDFIIIWTNFKIPSENTNEIASFTQITNRFSGLGRYFFDLSFLYGSSGKLKGVIVMGNINKYDPATTLGLNFSLNMIMHEILHNWAAYISFKDDEGQNSDVLLRSSDLQHWSYYAGFISPLGGSGWIDNGDGSFTNGLTKLADSNLRPYSDLDLYLMGLIPAQLMKPIMYLEPEIPNEMGNRIFAKAKYVTIDQIIKASEKVGCLP